MLTLSPLTNKLIDFYSEISSQKMVDQSSKLEVSRTVSFFGQIYEKMRNSLEYKESHLVRKAAIRRIIKRQTILNPSFYGFAPSLVKELLWGRYIENESISQKKVEEITKTIRKYFLLRNNILAQLKNNEQISEVSEWIIDLLSCNIELSLTPDKFNETYINFIYHWIQPSIVIVDEDEQVRDIQVYLAIQEAINKADEALLRYKFVQLYGEEKMFYDFWKVYKLSNKHLNHPLRKKLTTYIRKQAAPFLVLETIIRKKHQKPLKEVLKDPDLLSKEIRNTCSNKYAQVKRKLRRAAVRSIIYLFFTKMLVALVLEIPADQILQGQIDALPLAINTSLPPTLMFLIALFISPPDKNNTERIIDRIKQILTEPHLNTQKSFIVKKKKRKKLTTIIFSIIYLLTFLLVFGVIIWGLIKLRFNFASQIIFLFFLTVVSFFAYRIKQIPKNYIFKEKDSVLSPVVDFFMLPILSVGKKLSDGISKINILLFVFDFILEAPFKAVFEAIEQWVNFLRSKREEIA